MSSNLYNAARSLQLPKWSQLHDASIEAMLKTSQQWVAWCKADLRRAEDLIRRLSGKVSDVQVRKVLDYWQLHGCRQPYQEIADITANDAKNRLTVDVVDVTRPFAVPSMLNNDVGHKDVLALRYSQSEFAHRHTVQLRDTVSGYLEESGVHVKRGGPILLFEEGVVRVFDPETVKPAVYDPRAQLKHAKAAEEQRKAKAAGGSLNDHI